MAGGRGLMASSWLLITLARSAAGAGSFHASSRMAFSSSSLPALRTLASTHMSSIQRGCPRILAAACPRRRPPALRLSAAAAAAMSTIEKVRADMTACTPTPNQLSAAEYERQKVAGDGSCLFHSVAVSLGQGKTGPGLRSLAASEVSRLKSTEFNGASLEQWIEWETGLSASDYASRMSEGASWGGQVELALLAGALGRTIEVYRQEKDAAFTREHSFGQGDAVRLVYDGSHYDALVPRSGASSASASASASTAGDSESAAGKLPMFVEAAAVEGADRKWGMVVEGAPMPKGDDHTATVIWAHGLGDTGFGWSPVAQSFGMPWVKFIFPTAPVEPVTLNMGMAMNSWFDIFGLSADADEDTTGILSSAAYLKGLVDKEIAAGIPASRIVLAGFSQGGAIALTAGMAMDKPVAGVIAASTWLPRITMSSAADGMGGTPLLQCHGTSDKVVLYDWGKMSFEKLSGEMGVKGEFKSYPGMEHSFCPEELSDVTQFLQKVIPKV